MKTLLFINGSMGVGKTAVCKALLEQLPGWGLVLEHESLSGDG